MAEPATIGAYLRRQGELYEGLPALLFIREGRAREIAFGRLTKLAGELAAGLAEQRFGPGDRALLVGASSPEWALGFASIHLAGGVDASLEEDAPFERIVQILQRTDARAVFSDREDLLQRLREAERSGVLWRNPQAPADENPKARRRKLLLIHLSWRTQPPAGLQNLARLRRGELSAGAIARRLLNPERARLTDDPASIVFKRRRNFEEEPRGVVLSHRNILSNAGAFASLYPIREDELLLTGAPLWRPSGRLALFWCLQTGAPLCLSNESDFFRDLRVYRPTTALVHTRVLDRLLRSVRYGRPDQIDANSAPALLLRRIYLRLARCYHYCQEYLAGEIRDAEEDRLPLRGAGSIFAAATLLLLWPFKQIGDRLLRRSFGPRLGGRLRAVFSGGETASQKMEDLFRILGVPLLEGYWLAENAHIVACRTLEFTGQQRRLAAGAVGAALPGVELRIQDSRGEDVSTIPWEEGAIYIRSPSVMQGYFDDPEATRAALDFTNGWLRTGDRGRLTPNGDLQILGRVGRAASFRDFARSRDG